MDLSEHFNTIAVFLEHFDNQIKKFITHTDIIGVIVEFSKLNGNVVDPSKYTFDYLHELTSNLSNLSNLSTHSTQQDNNIDDISDKKNISQIKSFSSMFSPNMVNFIKIYNTCDEICSVSRQIQKYFVILYGEIRKYIHKNILIDVIKITILKKYQMNKSNNDNKYLKLCYLSENIETKYSKFTIGFITNEFKLFNVEFYNQMKKLQKKLPLFYNQIKAYELKEIAPNVYNYESIYCDDFKSCADEELKRVDLI